MNKVRVYELSKRLNISNKELIDFLTGNYGIEVKSHSSSLDEDIVKKVISSFEGKKTAQAVAPEKNEPQKSGPKPEIMQKPQIEQKPKTEEKKIHHPAAETKPAEKKPAHEEKKHIPSSKPPHQAKPQGQNQNQPPGKFQKKKRPETGRPGETPQRTFPTGTTATIAERMGQKEAPQLQTRVFPRPSEIPRYRGRKREARFKAPEVTMKESQQKWLELPESVSLGDLAGKLGVSANEIIKDLMKDGIMVSINQPIAFEMAAKIAKTYGFKIEKEKVEEVKPEEIIDEEEQLSPRPPVVAVLGHVDHGKTSLLDAIRNSNVTASESGGITQKIGAYTVDVNNRKVVFVDTPGHEAFTAMRARGAKVTDIAILVVAADDGVMPQTVEAINHARAAGVPIIVAINKIDKAGANPDKVKQQLAEFDLIPEDWGGDTVTVPVSAKARLGIEDLLEMILLVADMHEFKANTRRNASGIIIESKVDKGFGPVATVIVQNGTLKVGDTIIVGNEYGRVRFMIDDKGKRIKKALPSYPAEIIGLQGIPAAGDHLQVVEDERAARTISEERKMQIRTDRMQTTSRTSLEDLFRQMKEGEVKDLNLIIKADSNGSLEALRHSLVRLSTVEVRINIIHGGVGAISESDIVLAKASSGIIIGFNVRPDPITKRIADQEGIDVRLYRVIYHIIEDIKAAMVGMLEPEYEEAFLGRAEVRNTFKVSKIGVIAGSYVLEGKLTRSSSIRILRDNVVIYEGKLDSLRRFKDDVSEVNFGFECGLFIDKFPGIQVGDIVEAYTLQEIKRELTMTPETQA